MVGTKRFIAIVVAVAAMAPLALAQGGRAIATEMWDGANSEPVLSVQIAQPGMAAMVEWADPTPLEAGGADIIPFAKVIIYVKEKQVSAAGKPLQFIFTEKATFPAGKDSGPLILTFAVPTKKQTVWFQDPAGKGWISVHDLAKKAQLGYAIKILADNGKKLVLQVDSWPLGDPPIGWGPRPK